MSQSVTPGPPDENGAEVFRSLQEEWPPVSQGFDQLKRLLPQLERTSLTDEDLASVHLAGASDETPRA